MSLMALFSGCSSPRYKGPTSDHFDGERFFSPYGIKPKGFASLLKWQWEGGKTPWPDFIENKGTPAMPSVIDQGKMAITFVNHATTLIQYQNFNILTDPVWSERASPLSFIGPKRIRKPGVEFGELPPIDVVVISHNHYDHFDLPTIEKLVEKHQPLFLVALGDGELIRHIPGIRFREMDWYQVHDFENKIKIHFLPAQHWSARGFLDRNRSLWGSYLIEPHVGPIVYFGGDSGYAPHFKKIAEKFPRIDLALLPIGAYEPRWFMKDQHMNPEDAIQAHRDLKAQKSMGIHYGTWSLTNEGFDEPVLELSRKKKEVGVADGDFFTLEEGETRFF